MEPHPYGQAFVDGDLDRMMDLMADDVVFHSPVITDPGFEGRHSVRTLFGILFAGITDVEHTHELAGEDGTRIFVSNARVLGKPFKSSMLLEFNADGKIREIWVMARPLTGVVAIAELVGSQMVNRRVRGTAPIVRAVARPLAGMAAMTARTGGRVISGLNRETAGPAERPVSATARP